MVQIPFREQLVSNAWLHTVVLPTMKLNEMEVSEFPVGKYRKVMVILSAAETKIC